VRHDLPAGTVTFLFTDVEGSTRLLHELGAEGYAAALAEHRRVIREACAAQGGVEVDTQGDAFFFAFPTAPGALGAAAAFTEALASDPISVRVGLHTGTPLLAAEGYVGEDVHRAARIAASAHGGQVVLSQATAALVEASLTDLGEHRLKDVDGPVAIYQLGDARFPPLKTISNTNLPRPASSFVGRERELAEVVGRIQAGTRLLTLTGPGGSGKTRLALEAAATLVSEYKAGVFWVGLAPLRDPALVTETIAQVLGAKDGLAEHVGERELLLLLDNLEQVVDAAPELADLVERCPNLTLLVTSRELLRVRGEVEYEVPPLAASEAVDLFRARSGLPPSSEIAELCARLDSLPLAVELAAARTKALSVAQILERLSQRLDLLKGGRNAEVRHETLRATIEWSYDLLTAEEQRLFRRLAVFAGGCTLEAAEKVADADLDTLQSLVEKSLLRFSEERYGMLETIREYAAERLEEVGEGDELRALHGAWVLTLAETAEDHLRGDEAPAWMSRLDAEIDNIRFVMDRGVTQNPVRALRIAAALWWFWNIRGHIREPVQWLERAWHDDAPTELRLRALRARSALANARFDVPRLIASSAARLELARAAGDLRHEAGALKMLGTAAQYEGDLDRASALLEQSLQLWREIGDAQLVSDGLAALGAVANERGDLGLARTLMEENLKVSREIGDDWDVVWALENVGGIAARQGAFDEARTYLREGLETAVSLGYSAAFLGLFIGAVEVAFGTGNARDAAVLAGAVDARADNLEVTTVPSHDPWYRMVQRIQEAFGDDEFEALHSRGHSLEVGDAIALARRCLD
jgi:predicted ATPase